MAASADNNIFMTRHISIVTLSPLYLPVRLSGSFTFRNYVNT